MPEAVTPHRKRKGAIQAALVLTLTVSMGSFVRASAEDLWFDAATLKIVPNAPIAPGTVAPFRSWNYTPGRVTCVLPLRSLFKEAFKLKDWQISGPSFLEGDYYALEATMPEGTKRDDARLMLRALLKARLKLQFHTEQKVVPVYALIVDKDGFKLKALPGGPRPFTYGGNDGRFSGSAVPFYVVADALNSRADRPVIDETGIKGQYDFDLSWTPDPDRPPGSAKTLDPGLVRALREQAGLRLEPRKVPQEFMVIDHLEKTPTEN